MANSLLSWTLDEFKAKAGSEVRIAPFVNKESGVAFKSVVFKGPQGLTLVGFSSNLGELTPEQLAARKNELQVVQLESGNYKLCKVGEMPENWVKVNI